MHNIHICLHQNVILQITHMNMIMHIIMHMIMNIFMHITHIHIIMHNHMQNMYIMHINEYYNAYYAY